MEHTFYRRLLSAVCAIALAFTAVCPAVAAAPEDTTGTPQTLTVSEVQEMQQTDAAVTALTDSAAYAGMSEEERQVAALAQLDVLAAQGLVEKDSIYVDAENGMVSFAYRCGALGGILLTDTESEADAALPGPEMEDAPALLAAENGVVIAANYWGKFKTASQMVMIILLILNFGGAFEILTQVFVWASLALTVISLITYIVQNKNVISMQE